MRNYNDDDNRDGNQKGSLWDWLLALFLIRKHQVKGDNELENKVTQTKEKTTKKVEDKNIQLPKTDKIVNYEVSKLEKRVGVVEPIQAHPIVTEIKEEQSEIITKNLTEMFVEVDNYIKAGNTTDKKVVHLVDEIGKLIKKQLNKCRKDLDDIEAKIDSTLKKQDIDKLQKELNDIYNKLVLLSTRIASLRKGKFYNYDLDEDYKILGKVKALSEYVTRDEVINIIDLCDNKLVSIMDLIQIEEHRQAVTTDIDTKEGKITLRDQLFRKSKNKFFLIKDAESILKMAINEHNAEIDKIKEAMAKLEPTTKAISHIEGVGKLVGNTFKLAFGILSYHLSGTKSRLFGTMLIANSIKGLKKGITLKDEEIIYYEYSKFNQTINSTVSRLNGINYILNNCLNDLNDLRVDYIGHFKEYQNVLPEYEEFIQKIEAMQRKINQEKEKVQAMITKAEKQKKQDKILKKEMSQLV